MRKRDMIKGVLGFGATIGAGMIIGNFSRLVTPADAGKVVKAFIYVGSFGLAGAAGEVAENYITKQVDEVANAIDGLKDAVKNDKE